MTKYLEWLGHNQLLAIAEYVLAALVVLTINLSTGFEPKDPALWQIIVPAVIAIPAVFLMGSALVGLVTYFVFIPSIKDDGHVFSAVHGSHLVHPLTTSVLALLLAFCIYTLSLPGLAVWVIFLGVYCFHTSILVKQLYNEEISEGVQDAPPNMFFNLLNLIVGGEIVTVAAGAKPLPPWKLSELPENTWIIDVRTKSEFQWNRMLGAENYPWGQGVAEAAAQKSTDTPVLVTCFSGHRSPAVAQLMRRLGFKKVYNLNWGLLYLLLIQCTIKSPEPFTMTRSQRQSNMRGRDYRGISVGYITCVLIAIIIAPIEAAHRDVVLSIGYRILGASVGLVGMYLAIASFRDLGRNFRVFAAPRRSGALVTSGVYSRIRHPMYISVITSLAGYVIFWGSVYAIPFWLGTTVFYMIKAVKEEPLLMDKYPEYQEYKQTTWRFIPYVW
jgi:protein-S-isoprenylcysteine O-methyltransferase Ste14/rhodanese-related sulfurtransferase